MVHGYRAPCCFKLGPRWKPARPRPSTYLHQGGWLLSFMRTTRSFSAVAMVTCKAYLTPSTAGHRRTMRYSMLLETNPLSWYVAEAVVIPCALVPTTVRCLHLSLMSNHTAGLASCGLRTWTSLLPLCLGCMQPLRFLLPWLAWLLHKTQETTRCILFGPISNPSRWGPRVRHTERPSFGDVGPLKAH